MRRTLAVAALGLALMSGAACTEGDNAGSGSPTSSATGTPAPGSSGTGTASDKQVCDNVQTLVADSTQKFTQELLKAAQAGNTGAAETQAVQAVRKLLGDWASGLRTQSSLAANPELRTALSQWADGLDKTAAGINTAADLEKLSGLDTPELTQAAEKAEKICTT